MTIRSQFLNGVYAWQPRILGLTLAVPLLFLVLLPFLAVLVLSFTDYNFSAPSQTGSMIGFDNYAGALRDHDLWNSVKVSVIFVVFGVSLQLALGTLLALMLWRVHGRSRFVMAIFLLPSFVAPVSVGLLGRLLFHGDYGPLPMALSKLGFSVQTILGDPNNAFIALLVLDSWQWTPFVMAIVLLTLQSIPSKLLLAARLDGASKQQVLYSITLPFIAPSILLVGFIRALDSLREYDKVWLLTGGGPASATETLGLYTHRIAFERGELGYTAAIAIIGLVLTMVAVRVMLAFTKKVSM